MKPPLKITDWARILIGEVPLSFFVEALIRSAFVYLLLIVSMRLLGRRMASQMNATEMAALVSLAAAVGIPILSPDRGLLPAVVIAIVIVSIGRLSTYLAFRDEKAESLIEGRINILVEDGVLQLKQMKAVRITRERLFARLRTQGHKNLGGVRRVYLESSGTFSVVPNTEKLPGLSLIPDWDTDFVREQKPVARHVCHNCGAEKRGAVEKAERCENCGSERWVAAIGED